MPGFRPQRSEPLLLGGRRRRVLPRGAVRSDSRGLVDGGPPRRNRRDEGGQAEQHRHRRPVEREQQEGRDERPPRDAHVARDPVVGQGPSPPSHARADERKPRGVIHAGRRPPCQQRRPEPPHPWQKAQQHERAPHPHEPSGNEPPRPEAVHKNTAWQRPGPEEKIPASHDGPQGCLRHPQLCEPHGHEDRDRQLVGVDQPVARRYECDNGAVVGVHRGRNGAERFSGALLTRQGERERAGDSCCVGRIAYRRLAIHGTEHERRTTHPPHSPRSTGLASQVYVREYPQSMPIGRAGGSAPERLPPCHDPSGRLIEQPLGRGGSAPKIQKAAVCRKRKTPPPSFSSSIIYVKQPFSRSCGVAFVLVPRRRSGHDHTGRPGKGPFGSLSPPVVGHVESRVP